MDALGKAFKHLTIGQHVDAAWYEDDTLRSAAIRSHWRSTTATDSSAATGSGEKRRALRF